MKLELLQLLAPDVPSNKQVNLPQMVTKCQVDLMWYCSWPLDASTWGCGWEGYIYPHIILTHRLTKCHTDLQLYHSWPFDACTGVGMGLSGGQQGCRKHQGALGVTYEKSRWYIAKCSWNSRWSIVDNRTWAQVNGTQVSSNLCHQMPLPGALRGHMGWGYIWQHISLTHRLMTCHADLQ